jgi:hypothetical protein
MTDKHIFLCIDETQKKMSTPVVVDESSDEDWTAYESYEERILDLERRLRSHQAFFGKRIIENDFIIFYIILNKNLRFLLTYSSRGNHLS